MTRVTIDNETRKKLLNCATPLELCDEAGIVLAKLTPSTPSSDSENWIDLTPDLTDDEIQRAIDGGEETYSTEELINEIKKMRGI
jgi:hypothetical protein